MKTRPEDLICKTCGGSHDTRDCITYHPPFATPSAHAAGDGSLDPLDGRLTCEQTEESRGWKTCGKPATHEHTTARLKLCRRHALSHPHWERGRIRELPSIAKLTDGAAQAGASAHERTNTEHNGAQEHNEKLTD